MSGRLFKSFAKELSVFRARRRLQILKTLNELNRFSTSIDHWKILKRIFSVSKSALSIAQKNRYHKKNRDKITEEILSRKALLLVGQKPWFWSNYFSS